jgi:hypothetical protein
MLYLTYPQGGDKIDVKFSQNINDFWWLMHRSDDPNRQILVTCYLDDSGTDVHSEHTVVGGILLNKYALQHFENVWPNLLTYHRIKNSLHMKDFGNPEGPYKLWTYENKFKLFADIVALINYLKIYTIAATLNQKQFNSILDKEFKKAMGIYGMCYMLCAFSNYKIAELNNYKNNIAYVLDLGTKNVGHVIATHRAMRKMQKEDPTMISNVGTIAFEDDEHVVALQAADMIAWAMRRKLVGLPFLMGYEPIAYLLNEDTHYHYGWESKEFQFLKEKVDKLDQSYFEDC